MDEKPAVLVFSTAYFPFVGGAEVAIKQIAERLKNEPASPAGRFDL